MVTGINIILDQWAGEPARQREGIPKRKKLKHLKKFKKELKKQTKNQRFEITKECIKNIKSNQKHSHT